MPLSQTFLERTAGGLGSARYTDVVLGFGGSSCCEPEHLMPESKFSWLGYVSNWRVGYVQARPWTREQSPYCYSPLFGDPFPATLGQAMAVASPGAVETIQVPDAETAPVFEGLVLRIGDERLRVLSVSGTSVRVERGSESTAPAAHDPGPIAVCNRFPLKSLDSFVKEDTQITELVTKEPHRLRTGMQPTCHGDGWPYFPCTDGSRVQIRYYSVGIFVTGPKTFVFPAGRPKTRANTTLAAPVALDPTKAYSDMHLPEVANLPYSFCARVGLRSRRRPPFEHPVRGLEQLRRCRRQDRPRQHDAGASRLCGVHQ